jgi:hypothetical protein
LEEWKNETSIDFNNGIFDGSCGHGMFAYRYKRNRTNANLGN